MTKKLNQISVALMIAIGMIFSVNLYAQDHHRATPAGEKICKTFSKAKKLSSVAQGGLKTFNGLSAAPKTGMIPAPAERPAKNLLVPSRISASSANLYGVCMQFNGMMYYDQASYGTIDVNTGNYSILAESASFYTNDVDFAGGVVRKGILYLSSYMQDLDGTIYVFFRTFDATTGEELQTISLGNNLLGCCYSMTYVESEDMFYAMAFDSQANPNKFVKINPVTWDVTELTTNTYNASKGTFISGIAYSPKDDQIYGIRAAGDIVVLDRETGEIEQWGEIDDESWYVYDLMAQPLVYSPADNMFLAIVHNPQSGAGDIYAVDPETCEVFYLSTLKGGRFCPVIYCADPYAVDEAPAIPTINSINHVDAELSGNIEIAVPALTFSGETITDGTITLSVYIDTDLYENGTPVYSKAVTPGNIVKVPFETTEGYKAFKAVCSISDDLTGPMAKEMRYIGNDTPLAPSKVTLSETEISWEAPGAEGVHGGYVDTEAIRYNVYLNDKLLTNEPIAETKLTIDLGTQMTAFIAKVEAIANGHTSKATTSKELVHGDALSIPVSLTPTYAESRLFTSEDTNKDRNVWFYDEQSQKWIFSYNYMSDANDWLFMPVTHFADETKVYELSYTYENYYPYENEMNDMEVCFGTRGQSGYMINDLYKVVDYITIVPVTHKIRFTVSKPGEYYIGFHITRNSDGSGVKLSNFAINQLDESADVPDDCENLSVLPAEKGELKAVLTWTAPTKTILGNALDPNEEIVYTIKTGKETKEYRVLPGAQASTDVKTRQGWNNVAITPANSNGSGIERRHRIFTGIDTPVNIEKVNSVTAEDNLSMTLTWEPPTEGVNGGYIDPENLSYDIFNHYSIYTVKIGSSDEPKFVFSPGSVQMEPYSVGPRAVNSINADETVYSTDVIYVSDVIGPPYELPLFEGFVSTGGSTFNTYPWNYETTGQYANSQVELVSNLSNLGIGGSTVQEGKAIITFGTSSVATKSLISIPKMTTKGHKAVSFKMSFWNHPDAPTMILYGSHYGKEEKQALVRINPADYENYQWVEYITALPDDFADCGWIHLWIECDIKAAEAAYGVFDSFEIYEDVEYDFKIDSMTGTPESIAGETGQFMAVIENSGSEAAEANVLFQVFVDGKLDTHHLYEVGFLNPKDEVECYVDFLADPRYIDKEIQVVASIESADDMVPVNNYKQVKWTVNSTIEPIVSDLTTEWSDAENHEAVELSWSEPNLEYGDYDSFENIEDFSYADKLGQWINIDEDGLQQFAIGGLAIPDEQSPMAWQVINAEKLNILDDARLCPHSGKKYLMARSIYYDEETQQPIQNADWLISPEVVGGTTLGFWMCTASTAYTETIELWYSTTDQNTESFKKVRNFSKSGSEAWEYIEVTLPADAKYFALKYTSWGMFAATIDDIAFSPKELLKWDLKHYNVYRDKQRIAEGIVNTSYVDNISDDNYTYNVTTVVATENGDVEGILSNNAYAWSLDVDDITALQGVAGGKGTIIVTGHAGDQLAIYSTDGKYLRHIDIAGDNARVACDAGIYLVKVGNAIAKIVVK